MRWRAACVLVCAAFVLTVLSPLVQPAAADPPGAGDPPAPPGPGPISGAGGGEGPEPPGAGSYAPSSQTILNGTQTGGDCGTTWSALNASDDVRCSYQEANKAPADQLGVFLLPNGKDVNGWVTGTTCATNDTAYAPWVDLDDGPDTHDSDVTCRQGSTGASRSGVTLTNPSWTDAADIDDFNVTSSAVVKKVASQGASVSIDVKYESTYNTGTTQTTTTSYVRYSRFDDKKPGTSAEWNATNIDNLVIAVQCIDCTPNNRVTQIQANVDAKYNPEYALEVRFAWAGIPTAADSWLLIVECTRLVPGAEGVLVQVGQGGAAPTSWRTAYTCSSDNDTAAPVLPLSFAELNSGAPVVRIWDNQADTPDDTVRGTAAFDVLRIDVGPDGSVNSSFAQPLNYKSAYANNTIPSTLVENNVSYTYITTLGNYTFPKTSPHVMSIRDLDDRQMADASSFVIEGNVATTVSGAYVVSKSNTTFLARYNVTSGSLTQGTMLLSAVFNATSLPKLSATFSQSPNSTLTSWHVRWKITSPAQYLKNNDETTMFYGGFGTPQFVGTSPMDIPARAAIGIESTSSLWNSSLIANWSDMGVGTLYVGPVTIDANYTGTGMMIAFGAQVPFVDPSLVAQSYYSYATRYTNQKKVFFHDGRYYTFFHHLSGTVPSIRYSVGREAYSTEQPSASAMIWGAPIAVVTGTFQYGFDVDQRDGVVGLVWFDGSGYLKFKRGTVRGDFIEWGPQVIVGLVAYCELYVPTTAVALDGFFWVATVGKRCGFSKNIDTFRSTEPEGTSFVSEDSFPVSDVRVTLCLVPFPGGNMMLLASSYASAEITWRTWYVVASQWSSALNTVLLGLPVGADKVNRLSAAGIISYNGKLLSKAIYIDASNRVKAVWLPETAPQTGPIELDAGPAWYPVVQADLNNDVHYFWTEKPCTLCSKRIYYRWESYAGLSPTTAPFSGTVDPAYLASGGNTPAPRAFIAYTEYPGGAVYFASVPVRRGGSGAGDAAWQRAGISPHGLYFQQLSESVSVGSGLLYVKHTDLSIPGRGLDLSIQRLYRTPEAFAGNVPWGYDEPTFYSLGQGWTLNFPWLTWNHLYLWDGQKYVIKWDRNVFENKDGEYFRLERLGNVWDLYTKSGVKYRLNPFLGGHAGGVTSITDLNGNLISFAYSEFPIGSGQFRLDSITDTMGRVAAFSYTPTAYCTGSGNTPPRICAATYGGRTVEYRYIGNLLSTVVDPIGRTTSYEYCVFSSLCSGTVNAWLVYATVYTTGARTQYRYRSVPSGTDAVTWVVTTQKVQDADWVTTIRKKTYTYDFVNGAVAFAKVTHFAGETSATIQGYTLHNMDFIAGTATTTQVAANNVKLNQQRIWYGEGGRVSVVDAFRGAVAAEAYDASYSTYTHYDRWGNVVYGRDPMGEESFQSYYSSNNQSAFYGPGRLETTTPGKIWGETFRDRDIGDWGKSTSYGIVQLDSSTFGVLPPSLNVKTTVSNCCFNAIAWHTFAPQAGAHVINALVRLEESNKDHYIEIQSGSTLRIQLNFAATAVLKYSDGAGMMNGPGYVAGRWYRVTIRPTSSTTYDLFVDGATVAAYRAMMNSGSIDTIRFRAGNIGALAGLWVNEVHVFKGTIVTITGIQYGTRVRVLNPKTGRAFMPDVPVVGGTAYLEPGVVTFPRMIVQILDWEWSPIYTSPSREFWGGSVLDFVEPQFLKSGLTKLSSGFLRSNSVWLNDPPLPGAATSDAEGWLWKSDGAQVSGVDYHNSPEKAARHGHGFGNAFQVLCANSGNEYHIQYVYLRADAFPAEVLRAFEAIETGNDWNHRAYWGADLDSLGTGTGTDAHRYMGDIPGVTDRWLMLIMKHDDIANYGSVNCFEGTSYYVVSGAANWDLTAKGDAATGQIKVRGLQTGWQVTLVTPKGETMANMAIADANGVATLDVYSAVYSYRNAFPATGQFQIYQGGSTTYRSPWFEALFGGDEFQFSGSDFYATTQPSPYAKDRVAGSFRVQGTDYAGEQIPTESYYLYDIKGNLVESKARGPAGAWLVSNRGYDAYGNVQSAGGWVTDSLYHTTSYTYSPSYQSGYLTRVSDGTFGYTDLTYASNTGEVLSATPPKQPGQSTSYEYDAVGRLTRVTHPGGKFVTHEYFDSGRLVVTKDEMFLDPSRKRQTWQCYDAIGRLTDVLRFGDAGPSTSPSCIGLSSSGYYSWEKYTNNWQDQVTLYTDPAGRQFQKTFDFLGRVTRATNPDKVTWVDIAYDDVANTRSVSVTTDVQPARKTVNLYDRNGRLTEVREFWGVGPNDYYATDYAYDNVGNLLEVLTPPDSLSIRQRTNHSYDGLGRLTWTSFPDGSHEEYTYFLSGLLKQRRDRAGALTTYTYDDLKRVDVATYPDGSTIDHDYDLNGNLLRLVHTRPGPVTVALDYVYDARDRLTQETTTVDGTARTVVYEYDDASNVQRIQGIGFGYDMYYAYDAFNRACGVSSISISSCSPTTYYGKLSYYVDDALDTITYETGATDVTTKYTYGTNGLPSAIETKKGSTTHLRLDYEDYDALGDPIRIKYSGSVSTTYECFTYDAFGRLTASNTATASTCGFASGAWSWNLAYTYDALGNRLDVWDSGTFTYSKYDTYSRLCRTKSAGSPSSCTDNTGTNQYAYNANGETISRVIGGTPWAFLGWGSFGPLTSMCRPDCTSPTYRADYTHDGLGRRLKSVIGPSSPVTNVYVYSGLSVIYETNPATKYVFANGLRLAKIGASTEYYHYDHLGNVRLVTSGSNGNVLSTLAYKPFGLVIQVSGTEPKYGYTGEYREATPNLVYLHSRWYDPTIGRFISQDDRLGRLSMPQDQNRYAYVVNNPMAYTDPTGRDWLGGVGCALTGMLCFIGGSADWFANRASNEERTAFVTGVVVAFLLALVVVLACMTIVGCPVAIAAVGAVLMGGVVSSIIYWKGTEALGGTPTQEGLSYAYGWGNIAGGLGAGAGAALGPKLLPKTAAVEGKTAPDVANRATDPARFPRDPHDLQGKGLIWEDVSTTSQGRVLRAPLGEVELQYHGGHPLEPGRPYNPLHNGPHYEIQVNTGTIRGVWTTFKFGPGSAIPRWLLPFLGG